MSLNLLIFLCFFMNIKSGLFLKDDECEVCVTYVKKFIETLPKHEISNPAYIESEFKEQCKLAKGRENKFCFYLGGLEDSATGILPELSKPVSMGLPADRICERLKKKDSQICELRYEKQIDLKNVDLKKLKVRDLKKILNDWDESCDSCLEKIDFVKRIEELKPKYVKEEL